MIIGHTLNGAIRTTYLGVTFPFYAAGRMLYRGARGIVRAVWRVYGATRDVIVAGILATGRGIRSAVHAAGRMLYQGARGTVLAIGWVYTAIKDGIVAGILAIGRGIRWTVLGIGSVIALVFRSVINAVTETRRIIKVGILSLGRAILSSMGWIRHMTAAGAIIAAMRLVAVYRAAGSLARRVGIFIGTRYRAFVFGLASTTMTLSLEDGHARLLVLKGDRIIAWRSGQIAEPPEEPAADESKAAEEAPADEPESAEEPAPEEPASDEKTEERETP